MQIVTDILATLQSDGIQLSVGELLRYQQLTKLLDLTPKVTPQARLAGTYLTKHKGRGMEFDEARHYQAGDDIRAIDWRVTARTGKTHTKVYREERERPVFILCDLSQSMQFGTQLLLKAVQAAHMTALISWSAAARGDKVGALLFSDSEHRECKPLTRKRAVLAICHELMAMQQRVQASQDTSQSSEAFADACARVRRLARPGSLVYLISDFAHLDARAQQHISQVSRHCEVHAVMINDPMDDDLPQVNVVQPVSVTNGMDKQTWLLGDKTQHQRYHQWREQHRQALDEHFRQARVNVLPLSAAQPLDSQLLAMRGVSA